MDNCKSILYSDPKNQFYWIFNWWSRKLLSSARKRIKMIIAKDANMLKFIKMIQA